jgi:hypothetical protein
MKNTSNNDLLFLAPIVAIFTLAITIAAALYFKSNGTQNEANLFATQSSSAYNQSGALNKNNFKSTSSNNHSVAPHYQNFAMAEPFSEHVPFEFTPAAWMQMMNVFMNNMKITQMMHQMAAMPAQMMSPAMWSNPHSMVNMSTTNSSKPMNPEQYKKWYEQQLKAHKVNKK